MENLVAICPQCGKKWSVEEVEEGQRLVCQKCGFEFAFRPSSKPATASYSADIFGKGISSAADLEDGLGEDDRKLPSHLGITLEMLTAPHKGRVLEITESRVTLGRGSADIELAGAQVSRKHAAIEVYGDRAILLRDLVSTNGTFVNDRPVAQAELKDGDVIRLGGKLGGTELKLRVQPKSS
jgi:DNA-directed RNA polymerase subunit RPC12/RpoP